MISAEQTDGGMKDQAMNPEWNEKEHAYPVYVDVSMCNAAGALYPAAYQRIAVETIGRHLENMKIDTPRIAEQYGVAWVLLSMSIELMRPLHIQDRLTIRTWAHKLCAAHLPQGDRFL